MEPSVFSQQEFDLLEQIVESIYLVVKALIPDMALVIHSYGRQMTADGEDRIHRENHFIAIFVNSYDISFGDGFNRGVKMDNSAIGEINIYWKALASSAKQGSRSD